METQELIQRLWEGGEVQRCHTVPHQGSYNIAEHSWRATMLLLVLHPNPSMGLVQAMLLHDCHERFVGDMPASALWADGEYSKRYDQLCARVDRMLGIDLPLTIEERMWLTACDKAELYIWSKDQVALGNYKAATIVGNLLSWFNHHEIPDQVREYIEKHKVQRLHDQLS